MTQPSPMWLDQYMFTIQPATTTQAPPSRKAFIVALAAMWVPVAAIIAQVIA